MSQTAAFDLAKEWGGLAEHILAAEQAGMVSRTFRRLDPERQIAVINAILAEAGEHGPANLNMTRVAARAGVAVGSLYQYFPNRRGMLDFAVRLSTASLLDLLESGREAMLSLPLREALYWYLNGGMAWGQTQRGMLLFFGRAAYQGDPQFAATVVQPVAERLQRFVEELLQAAAARGEIDPGVDVPAAARAVNALLIALGDSQLFPSLNRYFRVSEDGMPAERVFQAGFELILRGLGKQK